MKRKSKIQEEIDKSWKTYNESIEKFVQSECKDFEAYKIGLRVYGRIEALTWVLENTDETIREL